MNARYYLPGIGRFLTADTLVPDPQNPQSYNRYSYTLNNPLKYTDPTGHISCEELGTKECGDEGNFVDTPPQTTQYDLTSWLVPEMSINAHDPRLVLIHLLLDTLVDPIGNWGTAMMEFYKLNSNKGVWNIKIPIRTQIADGIVLCNTSTCRWVDYSTPGNIHFGFMVAAGHVPLSQALIAGGLLESLDRYEQGVSPAFHPDWSSTFYDNPEDFVAVIFGWTLYQEYGADITIKEFQLALTIELLNSFQPPPPGFVPSSPPSPQSNHYPIGAFDND